MANSNLTEFGKMVRKKMIDDDVSNADLIRAVREKTGMYLDASHVNKILTGKRNAPVIRKAICEVLGLSDETSGKQQ